MSTSIKNYFRKEIRVLKFVGLNLTDNDSLPYKTYSAILLLLTTYVYPSLLFYEYFKHGTSEIANIIPHQIGTCTASWKVTILLLYRVKFRKLLAKLEEEPFTANIHRGGKDEERLLKECVNLTTKQTYIFWTVAFLISLLDIFSTFAKITSKDYHEWRMPFGTFTLFNSTNFNGYIMNWLYQTISCGYLSAQFMTIDLLLAAVMVHITYQFKMLQNILKGIVEVASKKMIEDTNTSEHNTLHCSRSEIDNDSVIPWKYIRDSVKEAVMYHVAIIDICKEIEEIFSYMLLMTFLGTLVLICFSTYTASLVSIQYAASPLFIAVAACMQVATICFWGEEVSQKSQLVAKAAYESNFVGTDIRFQKILALIIGRSQIPIKFSAGKFADICFGTFTWIVRSSYSFYMVLQRRNTNKDMRNVKP